MFKKPPYVFLPAAEFLAEVITHREGEERSKWVTDFAIQLAKGKGKDSFAQELLIDSARKLNENNTRTRRSRAKAELIAEGNKNPSRAEINERMVEMYGEDEDITAAATTREGVDVVPDRESGSLVRTTGCNNSSPDASVGNAEGVVTNGSPITIKGSRAICTSATSGQTIDTAETLDKAGAGEVPPESASAKPSPALPVLSFGEFGNIKMTNMQYAKLCERFGSADTVIEDADQYFEAQPAKKKYKNHYAMLLNWCKRRETEAKPQQGFKTAADRDREGVVKADGQQATQAEAATAATDSGEGGTPGIERTSSSLPSPTPVKPKTDPKPTRKAKAEGKPEEQKYPHGEFENIMLSTREYAQLCERLDNADSLIEEADGYFEAQPDKKRKYKSHYAMLLNWDRRRKEFEGVKPRFKTAVDRDQEEIRKLAEYYAEQESDERRDNPNMKLLGAV